MLTVKGLSFSYGRRSPEVLKNISLELKSGEVGVLLGRNGSGKTTLFRNILGIHKPSGGEILWEGESLSGMKPSERAEKVAYVPQDIRFGSLSVFDTVLTGRTARFGFRAGKRDYAAVSRAINDMGLTGLASRNVSELSGGERQKAAIARAMAQEPSLIVFDEPTSNLDIANGQLIINEASRLAKEKNIAVLSSLHDLNQALCFGDRFFFMRDGFIKYSGGREIFTREVIKDIFDIDAEIAEIGGRRVVIAEGSAYES